MVHLYVSLFSLSLSLPPSLSLSLSLSHGFQDVSTVLILIPPELVVAAICLFV